MRALRAGRPATRKQPILATGMMFAVAVAYFRTRVSRPATGPAELQISTVDDLALRVNGRFAGFHSRGRAAWFDFFRTSSHSGQSILPDLAAGENEIVVRVRGGVCASGGFFARVVGPEPRPPAAAERGPALSGSRRSRATINDAGRVPGGAASSPSYWISSASLPGSFGNGACGSR
jgi:hypothetical protein